MLLSRLLLVLLLPLTRPAPAAPRGPAPPDSLAAAVESARRMGEAGDADAAAEGYLGAADRAPAVAGWLKLSALHQRAVAGDLEGAAALAEELRGDAVVPDDSVRVELVRAALAAERPGRALREAEGIDGAGAPELWADRVARARLSAGDTAGAVTALRAAVSADSAPAAAGSLLLALDPGWRSRQAVAASDRRAGRTARAREHLAAALDHAPPSRAPELAARLAELALDTGAGGPIHRLVAEWLPREGLPPRVRARIELAHGRHHLRRGPRGAAEAPLERAAASGTSREAAYASYLLADLASARGEREAARRLYARTASRFPGTRYAGRSLVLLGVLAYRRGAFREAAEWLEEAARRFPDEEMGRAGLYWAGRAGERLGEEEAARAAYRRLARSAPFSYYGLEAAERSGTDALTALSEEGGETGAWGGGSGSSGEEKGPPSRGRSPGGGEGSGPGAGEGRLGALVERMGLLRDLGWRERALRELEVHRRRLGADPGTLLDLARRLNGAGWTLQGTAAAWHVFDLGGGRWSRPLLRELFPVAHRGALVTSAREAGLEPALVAALVRQESVFDRTARSRAGAVGLMQLLPATARSVARRAGLEPPGPAELEDPATNLLLGSRYLARLLARFDGSAVAALISYNAGAERFLRWRGLPEYRAGEDLFVERIPYVETRRYVKSVFRNLHLYRRLYDLEGGGRDAEEEGVDGRDSPG